MYVQSTKENNYMKKCKTCKAKMQSIMVFEGREYNTSKRSYCFTCSPPRLRKESKNDVDDIIKSSGDNVALQTEIPKHFFGPLSGHPRWVKGVDDLEEDLHSTYKFCEECRYSFTTSVEMKKEKIRKRGSNIPDYVIRYCHECYDIICAKKHAKILADKITQTSNCYKCKTKHYTYVPYSSLHQKRVTPELLKDDPQLRYDMICLSCENDTDNNFINEVEENIKDDIKENEIAF